MTIPRLASGVVLLLASLARAAWQDDIGFTALKAELGAAIPTGSGVHVTQVEGDESGTQQLRKYLPDPAHAQFLGKTFTDRSGNGTVSNHATFVGWYYYGLSSGIAPAVSTIDCYEAGDWLGTGLLRMNSPAPPRAESRRIQNHSWIGEYNNDVLNADILRRLDALIDRQGVVVCAGVNNYNAQQPLTSRLMPKLVCSAYNCIAVGRMDGNSSYGPTRVDVSGRIKPDLVATAGAQLTSYTTPVVGAAAALLLESQDQLGTLGSLPPREQPSARALLTKALLMGGAVKPTGWRKGTSTPSTDGTVPLDYRSGAGVLNILNSYHLLAAGRQPGGATSYVPLRGWDYAQAAAGSQYYFFQVPSGRLATASAMLVWNRKIMTPPDLDRDDDVDADDFLIWQQCVTGAAAGPYNDGCGEADLDSDGDVDQSDFGQLQACFSGSGNPPQNACRGGLTPVLANLNLRLHAATGFTPTGLRDRSISAIDNVEHIYLPNLPAGTYAFEVESDRSWPYALTWDVVLAP